MSPQIQVKGHCSKNFYVYFLFPTQEDALIVTAILNDLIDTVGETFNLTITKHGDSMHQFAFLLPSFTWVTDFAQRIASLQDRINTLDINVMYIEVDTPSSNTLSSYPKTMFVLEAVNGTYVKKNKQTITQCLRTIDDGSIFTGHKVPEYAIDIAELTL